ncbi:LPD7 domain-containing protein [Rhodoferax sp. GW822-FHT02A01]|uniref:LPD7 domain-containing protein n=1 Tax=Rhodoferax sp. GW822-FHT02A01 TaxID=3141537 RepID=UPI00315CE37C
MLIRVRGGSSGIKEYLERGIKSGREFSRDQLDERVMLAGDLPLTDTIINDIQREGERYLHITLAFKEDVISRETLQAITDEFRAFAMSAYESDEYGFYAEAHLPKIKSYTNKRTGEDIERKPHIHIVIPKVNLLTQTMLDPLYRPVMDKATGRLLVPESQLQWLEAFQEHTNAKYGLASPKEHRRIEFTDESAIIARYKGDMFNGERAELKSRILYGVLERNVTSFDQFALLVAEHGQARMRRAGQPGEYLNVKPEDATKGVNLKEWVFSREFIELPTAGKRQRLAIEARRVYVEAGKARPTDQELRGRLQHWHAVRSRELKYLNAGSKKLYAAYKHADPELRLAILAEREALFYQPHRKDETHGQEQGRRNGRGKSHTAGLTREPPPRARHGLRDLSELDMVQFDSGSELLLPGDVHRQLEQQEADGDPGLRRNVHRIGRTDNVVGQLNRDALEKTARQEAERDEFALIKTELNAKQLLSTLSHTHGVTPEKYKVEQGADGRDRIKAGSRRLNVSDFLTKELHLPWNEAAQILRTTHAQQRAQDLEPQTRRTPRRELWDAYRNAQPQRNRQKAQDWDAQRKTELVRRAQIRKTYQAVRSAIYNDRTRNLAERKAAFSIAHMERVNQDMTLRDVVAMERQQLRDKYAQAPQERYRTYLLELSSAGDEGALTELRRQRATIPILGDENGIERGVKVKRVEAVAPFLRNLVYTVDPSGNVTYYADQAKQRALVTDTGPRVNVESADDRKAVEMGLRLALQKFGSKVHITGTEEFKREIIDVAFKNGMHVEFTSKAMNDELQRKRIERDELNARGKEFIDRERTKSSKVEQPPVIKKLPPEHDRERARNLPDIER